MKNETSKTIDQIKIKDGFILREIADSFLVVAVGKRVKEFNGVIKLNQTGAFIWEILEKGATEEQVVERVIQEYEVERETVEKDVKEIVRKLKEAGLTE